MKHEYGLAFSQKTNNQMCICILYTCDIPNFSSTGVELKIYLKKRFVMGCYAIAYGNYTFQQSSVDNENKNPIK